MTIFEILAILVAAVVAVPMIMLVMLVLFTCVSIILMYAGLGVGAIVKAIRSHRRKS